MSAGLVDNHGVARQVALQASKTVSAAGSANEAAVTGLGAYKQALILLDVTAAAAASGDTLDVYVDTLAADGATWLNVVHFTQVLGHGGAKQFWAVLDPGGAPGTAVIAVATDANAGVVRPSMFTDQLRVRHVVADGGAHGQSFTFSVTAFLKR